MEKFCIKIYVYKHYIRKNERKTNVKERKTKMKKYVSCVILIVACIVCAMIFYVNAKTPDQDDPTESESSESSSSEESSTQAITPEKVVERTESGTMLSEYFCDARLRVEWNSLKYKDSDKLYLSAQLYLDNPEGISKTATGYFSLNGEKITFSVNPSKENNSLLCATECEIDGFTSTAKIPISAELSTEFVGEGGVVLPALTLNGTLYQSVDVLSEKTLLGVEHISQYPHLPSGDEITSLAMVLKYLKYNVNESELCDLYLDKGPVGYTDFYKANVGNPRDTYNSYGCLAPVIVNSATKFIDANGGSHKAYDYTGYNASELYRQVSLGNPVIVWLCDDFGNTPTISRIWVVDGKTLYLKSNMACMVLVGYDNTGNTVTLSNPAGNTFTLDKSAFEKSYADMGSGAVVVK